ncbi:hypothetical protein [Undibacterium oligocarboniphilum]|jgi:hypothetical protein|uniref:Uncharacterized protein n=1 Tax=Undibacterium oligocarboniphilum TaxID=666702 RepID=A0A850QI20_9BURK|nr:hypothetical protein [Undibacterium oligocarboniphilum]MBC3871486.1 hypothetical protein [Undibacterium oligocarboniphilum]NVO78938.1 hypothetical protein [Undibacterium oligocarboniphilum]
MNQQPEQTNAATTGAVTKEDKLYQRVVATEEVQQALYQYECARARRDSIDRKLEGGSGATDKNKLAYWEMELTSATTELKKLQAQHPVLAKHPLIAAVHEEAPPISS